MKLRNNLNGQKGFTIIELMISVVIFLAVISVVYQVMRIGVVQRNTINTKVDAMKGARISLNYIRRDIVNAGLSYHNIGGLVPDNFTNKLIGAKSDADTEQDWLTGIDAGNDISSNILNSANKMDSISVVTRDLTFNGGKVINFLSTSTSGTSVLVKVATADIAACKQFDLYLFEAGTTQAVGIATSIDTTNNNIVLGFGSTLDPLGVNLSASATGDAKSVLVGTGIKGTLKKINLTAYSIDASGALIRKTFGNQTDQTIDKQIETRELIYNVQDFQIKYLLDDGTRTDDPSAGNDGRLNQQKMNHIVEVQITLTVSQDSDTTPQASGPTTLKETISTRNLKYTIG